MLANSCCGAVSYHLSTCVFATRKVHAITAEYVLIICFAMFLNIENGILVVANVVGLLVVCFSTQLLFVVRKCCSVEGWVFAQHLDMRFALIFLLSSNMTFWMDVLNGIVVQLDNRKTWNMHLEILAPVTLPCVAFGGFEMLMFLFETHQDVILVPLHVCISMLSKYCCGGCSVGMRITGPYVSACSVSCVYAFVMRKVSCGSH